VVALLSSLGANVLCVDLEDHAEQAAKRKAAGGAEQTGEKETPVPAVE
jgi:hypothetical protein